MSVYGSEIQQGVRPGPTDIIKVHDHCIKTLGMVLRQHTTLVKNR